MAFLTADHPSDAKYAVEMSPEWKTVNIVLIV